MSRTNENEVKWLRLTDIQLTLLWQIWCVEIYQNPNDHRNPLQNCLKTTTLLANNLQVYRIEIEAVWPDRIRDTGIRLRWIDLIGIGMNSPRGFGPISIVSLSEITPVNNMQKTDFKMRSTAIRCWCWPELFRQMQRAWKLKIRCNGRIFTNIKIFYITQWKKKLTNQACTRNHSANAIYPIHIVHLKLRWTIQGKLLVKRNEIQKCAKQVQICTNNIRYLENRTHSENSSRKSYEFISTLHQICMGLWKQLFTPVQKSTFQC